MGYVGSAPVVGDYRKLDDISSSFNGSTTDFTLQVGSANVTPLRETTMIISVGGLIQEPVTAYTVSGSTISFTSAPATGADFFGVLLGDTMSIGTPSDGTITAAKLATTVITGLTASTTIADADLVLVDDGANGTLRKMTRADFIESAALDSINITGGTITGITDIAVADGGTGVSSFTDAGVLIGNGTGAIQATSAGTSGQVLTSNGAGVDPTFQTLNVSSEDITIDHTPDADTSAHGVKSTYEAGATVAFGDVCYVATDGQAELADADAAATMPAVMMALESLTAGQTGDFLLLGIARDDTWTWTVGGLIYVSTTAGDFTQTAPSGTGDQVQVVGVATHANRILFNPGLSGVVEI